MKNKNSSNNRILDVVKKAAEDTVKVLESPVVKDTLKRAQEDVRRLKQWQENIESSDRLTFSIAKHQFEKEVEENELRRLMLEKLRGEAITSSSSAGFSPPSYDITSCILFFTDKSIPIPPNSNQDDLCRVIFKNNSAMKRVWSWDEILEKSGEKNTEKHMWRRVYNAGREINKRVAIETGIKDLLTVKKLTVSVNSKYLK